MFSVTGGTVTADWQVDGAPLGGAARRLLVGSCDEPGALLGLCPRLRSVAFVRRSGVGADGVTGGGRHLHARDLVAMITPSRLVPEIDTAEVKPALENKYLVDGLRIVRLDNGRIERGDERFGPGDVKVMPLPERLGSGFVFYQADAQGTRLWRAATWTGKLQPLANLNPTVSEVVPGFDRLYLRTTSNKLIALEADKGIIMPLGQLPVASGYGAMAFADGWRALVDTDLTGPMASFDAGAS